MTKYFLKRLILAGITLLVVVFLVYMLMSTYISPQLPDPDPDNPGAVEDFIIRYGFDKAPIERFGVYLTGIFTRGDWGPVYAGSLSTGNIPSLFLEPLKYTLMVTVPAFVLSGFLAIILGFLAGYKRGTWIDSTVIVFITLFIAVPSFVIAIFLIGVADKFGLPVVFRNETLATLIQSLIFPILLLTLASTAGITYYVRNEVVAVLALDFIKVARSKGLNEFEVMFKHVFRNVLIPISGIIIGGFAALLSGSFVLERIFQIPGSAGFIIDSVQKNEVNVVVFSLIFLTGILMIAQILTDLSYVWLDPRIKIANTSSSLMRGSIKARKNLNNNVKKIMLEEVQE